jgi:peptide/nickel transport system permease protein
MIRGRAMTSIELDTIKYTLLLKGTLLDILKKMWRQLYPVVSTIFILQCSKSAVYEATLSYFGIGDPLIKSWGKLMKAALNYEGIFYEGTYMWYLLPPIICICTYVLALSILTFDTSTH